MSNLLLADHADTAPIAFYTVGVPDALQQNGHMYTISAGIAEGLAGVVSPVALALGCGGPPCQANAADEVEQAEVGLPTLRLMLELVQYVGIHHTAVEEVRVDGHLPLLLLDCGLVVGHHPRRRQFLLLPTLH